MQMAVMVFKRAVFETRRKPKGAGSVLKPKQPGNVKEIAQVLSVKLSVLCV